MEFSLNECPVCYERYDLEARLPMCLPQCGHTLCRHCCNKILHNTIQKCPLDRKYFDYQQPQVNDYALANLRTLQEYHGVYENCHAHKDNLKLLCLTDGCRICVDCYYMGEHQGHKVIHLDKINAKRAEKKRMLEKGRSKWDGHLMGLQNGLQDAQNNVIKMVENFFEEQVTMSQQAKKETIKRINSSFDEEQKRLQTKFGQESRLSRSISQKINQFSNMIHPELNQIVDGDIDEVLKRCDSTYFKKNIREYTGELTMMEDEVKRILDTESRQGLEFELPIREFIFKQEVNKRRFDKVFTSLEHDSEILKIQSHMRPIIEGDKLTITLDRNLNEPCEIALQELKQVNNVYIRFILISFDETDWEILTTILSYVQKIEELTFSCSRDTKDQQISFRLNLGGFLSKFGRFYKDVKRFNLCWNNNCESGWLINSLIEEILPNASSLQVLKMHLAIGKSCKYTFRDVIKALTTVQNHLEELSLWINEEEYFQLPSQYLTLNLPKLKIFSGAKFPGQLSSKNMDLLILNSIPSIEKLNQLAISLTINEITTERRVLETFAKIIELQNLETLYVFLDLTENNMFKIRGTVSDFSRFLLIIAGAIQEMEALNCLKVGLSNLNSLIFSSRPEILKGIENARKVIIQ